MWIIGIIIAIIIVYCLFSKIGDNALDNLDITDERDRSNVWWTIGMFADMHNKRKEK